MTTREELINNPNQWLTTNNLNLDFFDYAYKNIGHSYFLKKKDNEIVYYGQYQPESRSFICCELGDPNQQTIKREDIASFISLPDLLAGLKPYCID